MPPKNDKSKDTGKPSDCAKGGLRGPALDKCIIDKAFPSGGNQSGGNQSGGNQSGGNSHRSRP